jgi:hypothetical protein
MHKINRQLFSKARVVYSDRIFDLLPPEVKQWAQSLPFEERRYFLSLCYIICAASAERQAEFLDDYTADGLVSKMLKDHIPRELVKKHFKKFHINKELNNTILKNYIQQFYIHSAQDMRSKPGLYLEAVIRLFCNSEERNDLFNYILGFEVIKIIFKMSWLQHERLYRLQKNQESFIKTYIKPIQHTHRLNGIIVPRNEKIFFAKRDYFIKKPKIGEKKLIELVMATFSTDTVIELGFAILRNFHALVFDYDHIFTPEPEGIFPW